MKINIKFRHNNKLNNFEAFSDVSEIIELKRENLRKIYQQALNISKECIDDVQEDIEYIDLKNGIVISDEQEIINASYHFEEKCITWFTGEINKLYDSIKIILDEPTKKKINDILGSNIECEEIFFSLIRFITLHEYFHAQRKHCYISAVLEQTKYFLSDYQVSIPYSAIIENNRNAFLCYSYKGILNQAKEIDADTSAVKYWINKYEVDYLPFIFVIKSYTEIVNIETALSWYDVNLHNEHPDPIVRFDFSKAEAERLFNENHYKILTILAERVQSLSKGSLLLLSPLTNELKLQQWRIKKRLNMLNNEVLIMNDSKICVRHP
ncbi:MAG: hypothetical protein IKE58_07315 [Blautia sp.]|nr:hypothetical protein [Blautia sp.]